MAGCLCKHCCQNATSAGLNEAETQRQQFKSRVQSCCDACLPDSNTRLTSLIGVNAVYLSPWMNWFQSRRTSQSRLRQRRRRTAEQLENRTLLSVTGVRVDTELSIFVDEGDDVTVQNDVTTGNVQVTANGSVVNTIPAIQSSTLTALNVFAGDDDNDIDLSGLTLTDFAALTAPGAIVVQAGDGDDSILGSADFGDSILGGDGNDTIDGQAGDDTLGGGDGNDQITGGTGLDSLNGGDGNDTIDAGDGDDIVVAGNGSDSVTGGLGADNIDAGQGADIVDGGDGNDVINGMSGDDTLIGGTGDDLILGGADDDLVSGNDGVDVIDGQGGHDTLSGDAGDDAISGGQGNDSMTGGSGDDLLNAQGGRDTVTGDAGADTLRGGGGNDSMDGGTGDDTLFGNGGDDSLDGGTGSDRLEGGTGSDLLSESDVTVVLPSLSISDAPAVTEGNTGTVSVTLTVTLSAASLSPVSVSVNTVDGSATAADSDFVPLSTMLTFAPGETSQDVTAMVNGDMQAETGESFFVELSMPTNATLRDPFGTVAIIDDDAFRLLGIDFSSGDIFDVDQMTGASTLLGNTGLSLVHGMTRGPGSEIFVISQTGTMLNLFSVDPVTFVSTLIGPLIPAPTEFIEGDLAYDLATDTIYASFATVSTPNLYRIDPLTAATTNLGPLVTGGTALTGVADVNGLAFRNGELHAFLPGGLTGADAILNDALLQIDLTTREVTSVGPIGFDLPQGASGLAYDSNADVFILASTGAGSSDLFELNSSTGAGTLLGSTGVGNMSGLLFQASPPPPAFDVSDVTIVEGTGGTTSAVFTVNLSLSQSAPVSVDFTTVDGTAVAGLDYTAASGTLTFAAGVTTQTVTVTITPDANVEADETFFLRLSNPTVGTILANPLAVVTITNDDSDLAADTLIGGTGNDTLNSGNGDDVLNGGDGNDVHNGGTGNDSILGGSDNDTLSGGDGDDTLDGQGGNDILRTGFGSDTIIWNGDGDGDDRIDDSPGAQNVFVMGDSTVDTFVIDSNGGLLRVTEGLASITASNSTTSVNVRGGDANDLITLNSIADVRALILIVDGQAGNDTITAMGASLGDSLVSLNGGAGNDTITGGADTDHINGGDDDDLLSGNASGDIIDGGDGNDIINGDDGADTLLGNLGNDTINGGDGDDSLTGSFGNDVLMGNDDDDTIRGGFGNDNINGGTGDDLLEGDQDQDTLIGGSGADRLDGGSGNDTIKGQSGNDQIKGGDGNDRIEGNSGADTIDAGDGNDTVFGGNGRDVIDAGDGDDFVNGMLGRDTIIGNDGNDTLLGGGSADFLFGGDGTDTLRGNSGLDRFNSGQGGQPPKDLAPGEADDQNLQFPAAVVAALNVLSGF